MHLFYDGNGKTSKIFLHIMRLKILKWIFVALNVQSLQKIVGQFNLYSRCINHNFKNK